MTLDVHAIFGGSFNPPHLGHMQTITSAAAEFGLTHVNLLLAPNPPHKEIKDASLQQRMDMLALACDEYPLCEPDFTETQLPSPCYTVNTLRHLRGMHANKSIVFFLGSDSLMNIHTWYDWELLLDYAHLVVLPRPKSSKPKQLETLDWVEAAKQTDTAIIKQRKKGCLFFAETPLWDVSSTEIRLRFDNNGEMNNKYEQKIHQLVPQKVAAYIVKNNLYQPTAKNR